MLASSFDACTKYTNVNPAIVYFTSVCTATVGTDLFRGTTGVILVIRPEYQGHQVMRLQRLSEAMRRRRVAAFHRNVPRAATSCHVYTTHSQTACDVNDGHIVGLPFTGPSSQTG